MLSSPASKPASLTAPTVQAGTGATGQSSTALRDIMSEYDVTDITPADFSKMIQQLADRGALSAQEAQDMAGIRTELDKAGVSPDQSLNLVDFYRQQVAKTQANGAADPASLQKAVTPMLQRLSWLERFAGMHSQPDAVGIDSVA